MDRNIQIKDTRKTRKKVALRKESVDRNILSVHFILAFYASLSARRAWIEIELCNVLCGCGTVALRKESVDRNLNKLVNGLFGVGRSPQGERG